MSAIKQARRQAFNTAVLARDGYRCRVCRAEQGIVVHHITDRHEIVGGGSVPSNGIALCPTCHITAEQHHLGAGVPGYLPADLYRLIGSSAEQAMRDVSGVVTDHLTDHMRKRPKRSTAFGAS